MPTIDIANPASWPMRMLRAEVCAVLRISQRELQRRVAQGRFPAADDGRTWARGMVERYVTGDIAKFERLYARGR